MSSMFAATKKQCNARQGASMNKVIYIAFFLAFAWPTTAQDRNSDQIDVQLKANQAADNCISEHVKMMANSPDGLPDQIDAVYNLCFVNFGPAARELMPGVHPEEKSSQFLTILESFRSQIKAELVLARAKGAPATAK